MCKSAVVTISFIIHILLICNYYNITIIIMKIVAMTMKKVENHRQWISKNLKEN